MTVEAVTLTVSDSGQVKETGSTSNKERRWDSTVVWWDGFLVGQFGGTKVAQVRQAGDPGRSMEPEKREERFK